MAGNIKGITIEFNGDTTKLDKALREINNKTKSLDKELKQVDKALKFNPTSVELWRQKQQLLTQKVEETRKKLDALKQAQAKIDSGEVEVTADEYRKLQRDILITENQVKTFEGQLRKVGNVNLRATSEQFKEIGNGLTSAGHAMMGLSTAAAAVTGAIGAAAVKSGQWADDLNTMSKVYSISTTELQKYSAAADLVDVSVETIAKSHIKLEKQMLSASSGTGASAEAFQKLGVSVTNADGSLRNGDAVWQDTIAALGNMSNETERDALAMQLMGRSAAELNPLIEDNGETYKMVADTMAKYGLEYVDQDTLNKANQFNDSLDTMKLLGTTAFNQMATQLSAYLAPAMQRAVDLVGQLAAWFSNLSPETQTVIIAIAGVVAVLGPLLIGLGKVSFAISSIMSLASTLGLSFSMLTGPVGIAIAVFAALVAAGVLIYKNWDTIKAFAIKFKDGLLNTFRFLYNGVVALFKMIGDAIIAPIRISLNTTKALIDKVKSWFPIKIGNIFSNIKLPHFKLSGKFSLKDMTVPHLSVSWYKTGGIFDNPSVIGVGEAGPEAVVPLDKFWDRLDNLRGETNIVINVNGANRDPVEIAEEVKRVLIRETNQRRLAWQ